MMKVRNAVRPSTVDRRTATLAAVSHSSRRRCVMTRRISVRMMACPISHAWYGSSISDRIACANEVSRSSARRRSSTASGCRSHGNVRRRARVSSTGVPRTTSVSVVQNHGRPGRVVQPSTSRPRRAGASRLRRRLSRIFQRLIRGRWLRSTPPVDGTHGNSHHRICQSPRTHRRCRRACASTVAGKSSTTSRSVTNATLACNPSNRSWERRAFSGTRPSSVALKAST